MQEGVVEPDLVASTGQIHRSPERDDPQNLASEELLANADSYDIPMPIGHGSDISTEPSGVRVDMTSLNGLRGVAAVWIALFHFILYSTHPLDFQGSSIMPLFFMLSGFTLAIVYGSRKVKLTSEPPSVLCPCRKDSTLLSAESNQDNLQCPEFDKNTFRQNRAARVIPMYYLTMIFAIPPWFAGYGWVKPPGLVTFGIALFSNITFITTLFSFILGGPLNGPGWTICTLIFFWLYFHRWLPTAQRMTDKQLCESIVKCYWLQMITGFIFLPLFAVLGFWVPFAMATMNPLTRFPIFLMGMYAGILVLRQSQAYTPDRRQNQSDVVMLWPVRGCCSFSNINVGHKNMSEWRRIADSRSKWLLGITLAITFLDGILKFTVSRSSTLAAATWFQLMVPWWQLEVIVALTMCDTFPNARNGSNHPSNDRSMIPGAPIPIDDSEGIGSRSVNAMISPLVRSTKFLHTWMCQWFGQLGLTLYLVHFPLINYTCWLLYGESNWDWQDCDEDSTDCNHHRMHRHFQRKRVIPSWCIPLCFVIAVLLAWLTHVGFETPMRNVFRKSRSV